MQSNFSYACIPERMCNYTLKCNQSVFCNQDSYSRVDVLVDRWLSAHTLHSGCKTESGELHNTESRAEVSTFEEKLQLCH